MSSESNSLSEDIKAAFRGLGLDPLLSQYEEHALAVLESEGYPARCWAEFLKKIDEGEAVPERIADARTVLLRIDAVRHHLQQNDAEWAAWNAMLVVRAAIRAGMPDIESWLAQDRGKKGGSKKKGTKAP